MCCEQIRSRPARLRIGSGEGFQVRYWVAGSTYDVEWFMLEEEMHREAGRMARRLARLQHGRIVVRGSQ